MIRRRIRVFTLLAVFAGGLGTQKALAQKQALSLKQAVDYGMQHAVQVKNALLDIKMQQQTNREFTALAMPQVNASVNTTHYFNIPVQSLPNFISPATYQVLVNEGVKDGNGNPIQFPSDGFGTIAAQFGVPWTASGGVDVSQILFDGQVFVGLQARDASLKLAQATADVTKEQINANIQKIYYQLVVGNKQLESLEANIALLEKLQHDIQELFKNGFAEKLDVDKTTVQLTNLRTEAEKVRNQLAAGNAGLKFLIGMPQKEELILTDSLSEDVLKADLLDESWTAANRRDIQLMNWGIKLNQYNVKRYQLSRIPTVVAFGSYSKNAQRSSFNFFGKGDWFTTALAGIKITIPIFDGFARRSKIESARLALQKSSNQLEQMKEQAEYEVINARLKMKSAILTADNQRRNLSLAENVYHITKKKYEQGLGSTTEVFQTNTDYKVAQNNYYGALYDAITARIDYLKATGKL